MLVIVNYLLRIVCLSSSNTTHYLEPSNPLLSAISSCISTEPCIKMAVACPVSSSGLLATHSLCLNRNLAVCPQTMVHFTHESADASVETLHMLMRTFPLQHTASWPSRAWAVSPSAPLLAPPGWPPSCQRSKPAPQLLQSTTGVQQPPAPLSPLHWCERHSSGAKVSHP